MKKLKSKPPFELSFSPWVMGGLLLLLILNPSNAFGRSPGILGVLLIVGYMTVAFLVGTFISSFAVRDVPSRHVLTVVFSLVLNQFAVSYADYRWQILDPVFQSKIEYFCTENYNHDQCVRHVNACPRCALQIDRWKRTQMADNLKKYRSHYSPAAQKKVRELEAQRVPSTVSN